MLQPMVNGGLRLCCSSPRAMPHLGLTSCNALGAKEPRALHEMRPKDLERTVLQLFQLCASVKVPRRLCRASLLVPRRLCRPRLFFPRCLLPHSLLHFLCDQTDV